MPRGRTQRGLLCSSKATRPPRRIVDPAACPLAAMPGLPGRETSARTRLHEHHHAREEGNVGFGVPQARRREQAALHDRVPDEMYGRTRQRRAVGHRDGGRVGDSGAVGPVAAVLGDVFQVGGSVLAFLPVADMGNAVPIQDQGGELPLSELLVQGRLRIPDIRIRRIPEGIAQLPIGVVGIADVGAIRIVEFQGRV